MTTLFCWNNTIYDSANYSLCNMSIYNRMTEFCFEGKVYDKNGKYAVCCTKLYERFRQFCYNCSTYLTGFYRICGGDVYYIKEKFCYMECPFDRFKYEVCATKVIDKNLFQCVNNIIIPKVSPPVNIISKKREVSFVENGDHRETIRDEANSERSISSHKLEKRSIVSMTTKCKKLVHQ